MRAVEIAFWVSAGLIVYTHAGYPLLLAGLARLRRRPLWRSAELPRVSLVIAAHDEREVIEERVRNALALDYPPDRLEVIVASDGSTDGTAELARAAADGEPRVRVLDLDRRGKVRAQDAAVDAAAGAEVLAFSDANALWEPGALQALVRPFSDQGVGYVCGCLSYLAPDGSNQEGVYWRYENAVRALESRLASVTAGNGAIYAVRRGAYLRLDPRTSHDLSFPFNLVKRGWRAVYEPARARDGAAGRHPGERVPPQAAHDEPCMAGRARRRPAGPARLRAGVRAGDVLAPRAALRDAVPARDRVRHERGAARARHGLRRDARGAAGVARRSADRPAAGCSALCRYYVLMTASLAAGLWDMLRRGTPATWEREGVR